jgi:lysophospholipase L1-like esterase
VLAFLPEYIEVVEKTAKKFGTRYVPLQDIFQKHLQLREADVFCPEPVHPNRTGHMVIADAIMRAIEK